MATTQIHDNHAVEEALLRQAARAPRDRLLWIVGITVVIASAITLVAAIATLMLI